jgi:hypothetical protein
MKGTSMKSIHRFIAGLALLLCGLFSAGAQAQVDLTGSWSVRLHEDYQTRFTGPDFVDYAGIPLAEEGLAGALSYTTSLLLIDRSCAPWPAHYIQLGPWGTRISSVTDKQTGQVVAWRVGGSMDRHAMTIWVDGRPPPGPEAMNTFAGYSIGRWEGNTLIVTTTHVKDGHLTRNGVPSSSRATMTFYISRFEDHLTVTTVVEDPIYLAAPYVLSHTWVLDNTLPVDDPPQVCTPEEELESLADNKVPHFLPGKNTSGDVMTEIYNLPKSATQGGIATMFPEFVQQLKVEKYTPAGQCTRYCCGSSLNPGFVLGTLMCKHGP